MAADGTITLATKIDTKGIKNGENTVKNAAERMGEKFSKAGQRIQAALNGGTAQADKLALSMQKASVRVEEQSRKVDNLKARLEALNSGQETVTNPEIRSITRDLDSADAKIRKLKAQLATMQEAPSWQQDTDKMAQLKAQIEAITRSADIMGERLRNAVSVETQAQIDKTTSTLRKEEIKLEDVKAKAQQAGDALKSNMTGAVPTLNTVTSGIEKFSNRVLGLAKRVFVFTLITKALRSVRAFIGDALMSNEDFRNSLNKLKAALYVAFQPIYQVVLPALKTLIQWITNAITTLTKLFAALTGRSYASMVANAKALQEQTKAYKNISSSSSKAAKDMKKTTKEAEKQIAAFDELSILSENKSDVDINADTNTPDTDTSATNSTPDFESLMNDTVSGISNMLQTIMKIAGGALVAIGLVLLFMGNIGWGIGFIIAGAAIFAVAEFADGDFSKEKIITALMELSEIVGTSLMVIGCILLFFGNISWGIGFIIAGAVMFGISEAMLSSNDITTTLQEFFQTNGELILGLSLAMLVIGVILLFVPGVGLTKGIALIILGLTGIVTEVVMNKDGIMETVTEFFQSNADLILALSTAMLVIGVILLFTPMLGLGIALIVMGLTGIVTEIVLNSENIMETITEFFQSNSELILALSAAMLIIGIILLFTPMLGLGIALVIMGLAGVVAEVTLNWEAITETITKFFEENAALIVGVSLALVVIGVILLITSVGIPLGLGMIIAGGALLATEVAVNWETISEKIKETFEKITEIAKTVGLIALGVLLCFTGVGIPLGIALIKKAFSNEGSAEGEEPIWDVIPNKIKEVWASITKFWDENIAKWFEAETWLNLVKDIGKGLLDGFTSAFEGVIEYVKSAIEKIQDLINSIGLGGITSGISGLLSGVTGETGAAAVSAFSASVPALASGAVLPANKPFLAMVGDQKSGTNIEAPLETMVEAFQIALASQEQNNSSTVVPLVLDGRELGRAVINTGKAEIKRTKGSGYATKVVY